MTLKERIDALSTRIAAEIKAVRASVALLIADASTSTTSTWSSSKIDSYVVGKFNALVNGAPAALDTLSELAAQMQADETAAAALTQQVSYRVRFDAAQSLTSAQQTQARANIGALSLVEIGNPDSDFVATFNAALAS